MAILPKNYFYHNGVKEYNLELTTAGVARPLDTIKVDGVIRYTTKPAIEIHVYAQQAHVPSWRVNGSSVPLSYSWDTQGGFWRVTHPSSVDYLHPNAGGPRQNEITRIVCVNLQGLNSLRDLCRTFRNMTSFEVSESAITSHISNFNSMLFGCNKLVHVDFFNTSKGNDFFEMFRDCFEIQALPTFGSDIPADYQGMFQNCRKLNCIGGIDTTHTPGTMSKRRMFDGTSSLSAPRKTAGQAKLMSAAGFNYQNDQCPNINYSLSIFVTSVAKPKINMNNATPVYTEYSPGVWRVTGTGNVIHVSFADHPDNESVTKIQITRAQHLTYLGSSFVNCPNLVEAVFDSRIPDKVGIMSDMFNGCKNLERVVGLRLDSCTSLDRAFYNCEKLGHLERSTIAPKLTTAVSCFENCTLVLSATLKMPVINNASSMYKNSGVTSINNDPAPALATAPAMFQDCKELIDVPALDMPELVTANGMFRGCDKLRSIASLKVPKLKIAGAMFTHCPELLTIAAIDMPEVITANAMCQGNEKLVSSGLTGFGKATNLAQMYNNCYELTSIGDIDYSAATTMWGMYLYARSMVSYKRINSGACTNFDNAFYGNHELACLVAIDTTAQTSVASMFGDTPKLIAPNATDRTAVLAGSNWTNPNPCP